MYKEVVGDNVVMRSKNLMKGFIDRIYVFIFLK